ncbi:MAG: glycine cleavage system aminomethyltransferase GcvT [Alphaproteobacteria bacterium]|nr:glycine cleavage system aminomethyltransferase GcvT [Alphaproteobacteria bacterium]
MVKKTALHEAHKKLGAKMGEFAGYDMPLYYGLGVMKEHEWTRNRAGLFDVSHMGQIHVKGMEGKKDAVEFFEKITPSSFQNQKINRTKYTVLTNEQGGIIDDLMVTRTGENEFHCVINAGCKDKDIAWIKSQITPGLDFHYYDDLSLIALQGQASEKVIRDVLGVDLSELPYMGLWAQDDNKLFISRLGYTGEDGFELSVPDADAEHLWNNLLSHEDVQPIGLAARDSLRLEMGYCLYGHDIDATTSPLEADLGWVMGKDNTGFIGTDVVLKQKAEGITRKRVGIKLLDKGVAREGAEVQLEDGAKIGELCSGGFSPTLGYSIGQAYLPIAYVNERQKIIVNVRGRAIKAEVAKMPFLAPKTKTTQKVTAGEKKYG